MLGCSQRGGDPDLRQEPLGADGGARGAFQDLEGDLTTEVGVVGQVHHRSAAGAELPLDAVPVGQGFHHRIGKGHVSFPGASGRARIASIQRTIAPPGILSSGWSGSRSHLKLRRTRHLAVSEVDRIGSPRRGLVAGPRVPSACGGGTTEPKPVAAADVAVHATSSTRSTGGTLQLGTRRRVVDGAGGGEPADLGRDPVTRRGRDCVS